MNTWRGQILPLITCDKIDCEYYDSFDFCTKRIIEIKNGICQYAADKVIKDLEEGMKDNEQGGKTENITE